jgi:hypothetical protein
MIGLVIGGVGVVGLGAGGALALVAKVKDNNAAAEPFPAKHDDSLDAAHLADVATGVVVAGAAVAVAGAILWITAPRATVAVGTSGHQVILRGTF